MWSRARAALQTAGRLHAGCGGRRRDVKDGLMLTHRADGRERARAQPGQRKTNDRSSLDCVDTRSCRGRKRDVAPLCFSPATRGRPSTTQTKFDGCESYDGSLRRCWAISFFRTSWRQCCPRCAWRSWSNVRLRRRRLIQSKSIEGGRGLRLYRGGTLCAGDGVVGDCSPRYSFRRRRCGRR